MFLKTLEAVGPEPLVMREPVAHRAELLRDEAVAALAAVPLLGHQTGVEQDTEVLGDGWAAHREVSRNVADGALGFGEEVEHPATRRMADRSKDIGLALGSRHHAAIIRKQMLTCQDRIDPPFHGPFDRWAGTGCLESGAIGTTLPGGCQAPRRRAASLQVTTDSETWLGFLA